MAHGPGEHVQLTADYWSLQGSIQAGQGNYEEAIRCAERGITLDPRRATLWMNKGKTHLLITQHDEALVCFSKVIDLEPDNTSARAYQGFAYALCKKGEEATLCFREVMQRRPAEQWIWELMATGFQVLGKEADKNRCIECFREIQSTFPQPIGVPGKTLCSTEVKSAPISAIDSIDDIKAEKSPMLVTGSEVLYEKGTDCLKQNKLNAALDYFEKAIGINPNVGINWVARGSVLTRIKSPEEAIRCFDQALKINSHDVTALVLKGFTHIRNAHPDEALQYLSTALELHPSVESDLTNLAEAFRLIGQEKQAVRCEKYIAERIPIGELLMAAVGHIQKEEYNEAISCFDRILAINPNHPVIWKEKAHVLVNQGKLSEALTCLDRSLENKPDFVLALVLKGFCLMRLGNLAGGTACYNRSLEFEPYNIDIWLDFGGVYADIGDYEKAIGYTERALGIDPCSAKGLLKKGMYLYYLGMYEKAIPCIDRVLESDPENRDAWRYKGYCLNKRGNGADARVCFAKANNTGTGVAVDCKNRQFSIRFRDPETGDILQTPDGTGLGAEEFIYQADLGKGGFGRVTLVFQPSYVFSFAMKTCREEFRDNQQVASEFRNEAELWIHLGSHPNIVRAVAVRESKGQLSLIMEYIPRDQNGLCTLEDHIRNSSLETRQILHWAIQVCNGMEYAYLHGIRCHRDLKPANILIGPDRMAKVTDFGLAGALRHWKPANGVDICTAKGDIGLSCMTEHGAGIGTPFYMPPEQFLNITRCDERSDIYSFGVTLYQMVSSGNLPFVAVLKANASQDEQLRFLREMFQLHVNSPVPALKSPVFPVIQKCMEKSPDKRYRSFSSVRKDLEDLLLSLFNETSTPVGSQNDEILALMRQVTGMEDLKKYPEAISYCDQVLKIDPTYLNALAIKAQCCLILGRNDEAGDCFSRIIRIDPNNSAAKVNIAIILMNTGHLREALDKLDSILKSDPGNAMAAHQKGYCYQLLGDVNNALIWYRKAVQFGPEIAEFAASLGNALAMRSDFNEAIPVLERALSLNPSDTSSWVNKGNCHQSLGQTSEALRCFDDAIKRDSTHVVAWINKGWILLEKGRYSEAIGCSDECLKIDGTVKDAYLIKALCFSKLKNLDEYQRTVTEATGKIPDFPDHVQAYIEENRNPQGQRKAKVLDDNPKRDTDLFSKNRNALDPMIRALKLATEQRFREALPYVEQALAFDPDNIRLWLIKAVCNLELGNFDEADIAFQRSISLNPQEAAAWRGRGKLLYQKRCFEEALSCIDTSIRFSPADSDTLIRKAHILHLMGRSDEGLYLLESINGAGKLPFAKKVKEEILITQGEHERLPKGVKPSPRISPDNFVSTNLDKAITFMENGEYREALNCCDSILAEHPEDLSASILKGRCLALGGRKLDAIQWIESILGKYPSNDTVWVELGAALMQSYDDGKISTIEIKSAEKAIGCFNEAIRLNPGNIHAYLQKGRVYYELSRLDESLACYDKATSLDPGSIHAWEGKALTSLEAGRFKEALACCKECFSINPRSKIAEFVEKICLDKSKHK